MTTIKDMVADARRLTYGSMNDQINVLAVDADAGAASIVMDMDVSGITPGMILSSGLNVWYTKGIDVAAKTVYVIPGYDNAPQDAVTAGTFVYIKPRVTDWYLFNALNREITRLSSPDNGLYTFADWTEWVDPTYQTYTFPADVEPRYMAMLRVRYRMPGTSDVWMDVPEKSYRVQVNPISSTVRLLRNIPSGTQITFQYKAKFAPATSLADDPIADCGLTESMLDIPALGMYATLLRTSESRRLQPMTQGDSRRASEVPATGNAEMSKLAERQYQVRVQEELSRLMSRVSLLRSI